MSIFVRWLGIFCSSWCKREGGDCIWFKVVLSFPLCGCTFVLIWASTLVLWSASQRCTPSCNLQYLNLAQPELYFKIWRQEAISWIVFKFSSCLLKFHFYEFYLKCLCQKQQQKILNPSVIKCSVQFQKKLCVSSFQIQFNILTKKAIPMSCIKHLHAILE